MKVVKTKHITSEQFQQIDQLWNDEYPLNLKDRFPLLLDGVPHYTHYLIEQDQAVIAWAVAFEKDNETRFSIIVSSVHQGKGLGKLLINELKKDQETFYGWVIDHNNDLKSNGKHYLSPIHFYLKNGFKIVPNERIENEMITAVKIKNCSP